MKINAFVRVNGRLCALVPYRAEHVPRYHAWMQNEWIRGAPWGSRSPLALSRANGVALQR